MAGTEQSSEARPCSERRSEWWHPLGGLGIVWPAIGLAGSIVLTLAGPKLVDGGVIKWWFSVKMAPGHVGQLTVFYIGMAALCAAWLALGARIRSSSPVKVGWLAAVGVLWTVPIALGPALFSSDVYSYMAQGMVLHLGHSPYHEAPVVLGRLGERRLLDAVSPFWRHTTAPYGPLFLWIVGLVTAGLEAALVPGVIVLRLLEIAGVVLLAVFVPRLARLSGTDPVIASWLAVVSPLVLLELVAAGHNDALMAGLMVAGVTLALERRPLAGVALCALAATIKLPALVAVAFIAVAWAREREQPSSRAGALAAAAGVAVLVLAAVSAGTGAGLSWISPSVVSTPGKVHLAVTPVTDVSWTTGWLLRAAGVSVHWRSIQSGLDVAALAATAVFGLYLLWRCRRDNLAGLLGVLLLVAAATGPAAWPWYFSWGLPLVATRQWAQRSRALALAIVVLVLEVKPDGILALPVQAAPVMLVIYLALGAAAWRGFARRRRGGELVGSGAAAGTLQGSALL
jgi:hypothetical protein